MANSDKSDKNFYTNICYVVGYASDIASFKLKLKVFLAPEKSKGISLEQSKK